MCGIYGFISKNPLSADKLLHGLRQLEYRGYDSFGIVTAHPRVEIFKQTGKISSIPTLGLSDTTLGIGHTRWATHGGVTQANAHPHFDCRQRFALVHNGIINNYQELKNSLQKHLFKSVTDSEVIVHLVEATVGRGSLSPTLLAKVLRRVQGNNAFILVDTKEQSIWLYREGSPLCIGKRDDAWFVASDPSAVLRDTPFVHVMEEGELVRLSLGKLKSWDLSTLRSISVNFEELKESEYETDKGEFDTFMLKEIYEQPAILETVVREGKKKVTPLVTLLKKADSVVMVACGSSLHAAHFGAAYLKAYAQLEVAVVPAHEWEFASPRLTQNSVVVALSQSGETMDTLKAIRSARGKKAKIVGITNGDLSSLKRESDYVLSLGVGVERAVATTKAFTATVVYLLLATGIFAGKDKEVLREVETINAQMKAVLHDTFRSQVAQQAYRWREADHLFVLGKGISFAAALEAALKIKEISYIHAEAVLAGELKHGIIALIESGTPCLVLPTEGNSNPDMASAAAEVAARGAEVTILSEDPAFSSFEKLAPAISEPLHPIVQVVIAQLLTYELARLKGLDIDLPRNLAKSVTVG